MARNPGPPERHLPETLLMDRGSSDEISADSQEPQPPDTRRDGKRGSRMLMEWMPEKETGHRANKHQMTGIAPSSGKKLWGHE
jgi:hypothetical protein